MELPRTHYPDSKLADSSTVFMGAVLKWTGRPEEAKRVPQELLQKRPDSPAAEGWKLLGQVASTLKDKANSASAPIDAARGAAEAETQLNQRREE